MTSKQIAKIRDKTYGGMDDRLNKKRARKCIRRERKKEVDDV